MSFKHFCLTTKYFHFFIFVLSRYKTPRQNLYIFSNDYFVPRQKFSGRRRKIRLKHKILTVSVLLLCLPLATIISTNSWNVKQEISFYVLLEAPEKQVIVDEIINKLESLGLIVNTVYFTDVNEWSAAQQADWPDVTYGGLSYTFDIDNIFTLAYLLYIQKNFMFAGKFDDKKFSTLVDDLTDMYMEAAAYDFIVPDEFINEMIDIFQKIEKRLWNHLIVLPFVQWVAPFNFPPFSDPAAKTTEIIMTNSVQGRVFSNLGLRRALYRSIDRNVFLDYHALYNPYPVYVVYHLYQMSIYHDTNLPNN